MFDTKRIGARIAQLRKAKDLTQMELADQMLVSFQAVSNWERGNSMPDISKLGELSQILGVSIEDLLGSAEESQIIEKVVKKDPEIKLEEIVQVAPVLKPSQLEEAVENKEAEPFDLGMLISLAPFVSSERLSKEVQKAEFGKLSDLVPLAPFLESDTLSSLAAKLYQNEKDPGGLVSLAPFLSEEVLGALADQLAMEGQNKYLIALAPFMDSRKLTELVKTKMQKGKRKHLRALLPFINADDLF